MLITFIKLLHHLRQELAWPVFGFPFLFLFNYFCIEVNMLKSLPLLLIFSFQPADIIIQQIRFHFILNILISLRK